MISFTKWKGRGIIMYWTFILKLSVYYSQNCFQYFCFAFLSRKALAEKYIMTSAKLIAPAIESSFAAGFDWWGIYTTFHKFGHLFLFFSSFIQQWCIQLVKSGSKDKMLQNISVKINAVLLNLSSKYRAVETKKCFLSSKLTYLKLFLKNCWATGVMAVEYSAFPS